MSKPYFDIHTKGDCFYCGLPTGDPEKTFCDYCLREEHVAKEVTCSGTAWKLRRIQLILNNRTIGGLSQIDRIESVVRGDLDGGD